MVAPPAPISAALYPRTLDCVHCGLCLSSCPTYRETGREGSSPRGRIYLMRGVAEGRLSPFEMAEEAALCLGCRACETACPSGVQYGALLELARETVVKAGARPGLAWRFERLLLRQVVARSRVLRALVSLLRGVQRLGLDRLTSRVLPAGLRDAQASLPAIPSRSERAPLPERTPASAERRGEVAFFTGCVMAEVFAPTHRATLRVLAANGFEVVVPGHQGCCGALHAHAGDLDFARQLLRSNVAAFAGAQAGSDLTPIIVNSAGCGASLRDGENWIGEEGRQLGERIRDVCEFLDQEGWRAPLGRLDLRVCYDDPCHLLHGQQVAQAPRRLLSQIPGLTLVPHQDAEACCGAAGSYTLTQPEMSARVLARKMDALAAADPDVIVTGNPGCLMQIARGVRERGLRARVLHPIDLLAQAIEVAPG